MASSAALVRTIDGRANYTRLIIRQLTILLALTCVWGCAAVDSPAQDRRVSTVAARLKAAMADYCAQEAAFAARAKDESATDANSATGRNAARSLEEGFGATTIAAHEPPPSGAAPTRGANPPRGPAPRPTACTAPVELSYEPFMYASANGKRVKISQVMLNFAADDSELAFILGHELAHVLLHHSAFADGDKRRRMELEADYVGIYIVARAGYDVDKASRFIERLAGSMPALASGNAEYPSAAERDTLLHRAVTEIDRKIQARLALAPSLVEGDGSSFGFIPHLP
jgi:Peptidase family M48